MDTGDIELNNGQEINQGLNSISEGLNIEGLLNGVHVDTDVLKTQDKGIKEIDTDVLKTQDKVLKDVDTEVLKTQDKGLKDDEGITEGLDEGLKDIEGIKDVQEDNGIRDVHDDHQGLNSATKRYDTKHLSGIHVDAEDDEGLKEGQDDKGLQDVRGIKDAHDGIGIWQVHDDHQGLNSATRRYDTKQLSGVHVDAEDDEGMKEGYDDIGLKDGRVNINSDVEGRNAEIGLESENDLLVRNGGEEITGELNEGFIVDDINDDRLMDNEVLIKVTGVIEKAKRLLERSPSEERNVKPKEEDPKRRRLPEKGDEVWVEDSYGFKSIFVVKSRKDSAVGGGCFNAVDKGSGERTSINFNRVKWGDAGELSDTTELDDMEEICKLEKQVNETPVKQLLPVEMYAKTPKNVPKVPPKEQESVSFPSI